MNHGAIHTFPDPRGGWVNKLGDKKINSFSTKDVAVKSGKILANSYKTKHYIYSRNNRLHIINDYSVTPHVVMKLVTGIFPI